MGCVLYPLKVTELLAVIAVFGEKLDKQLILPEECIHLMALAIRERGPGIWGQESTMITIQVMDILRLDGGMRTLFTIK